MADQASSPTKFMNFVAHAIVVRNELRLLTIFPWHVTMSVIYKRRAWFL